MPVELGTASIGRGAENQVQLEDDDVSRRHARIVREGRRVWVEDLGSHNGILVNDNRVTGRVRLYARDLIQIGIFSLELTGESLAGRGDETTEPNAKMPETSAADEPTDRTFRPPDLAPDDDDDDDRTEIVDNDGTHVLDRSNAASEATKIVARPSRAPPVPYLAIFGAFVLLIGALVWLLVDPLAGPTPEELAQADLATATAAAAAATEEASEPPAAEEQSDSLALEAPGQVSDAGRLLVKAHEAIEAKRFAEAERLAKAALVLEPNNVDGQRIQAQARALLGENGAAP